MLIPQIRTRTGIWFRDLRRATNLPDALEGCYAPEGLKALAHQDLAAADAQLKREAFHYGFPQRPYQRRAIEATEAAIASGQREILLAMATGTGKTKTCGFTARRSVRRTTWRASMLSCATQATTCPPSPLC